MNTSRLSLSHLRAFQALVTTGSFTEAGKALRVSQSAISHGVSALESALDLKLIESRSRHARTITLSDAGREVLSQATEILSRVEALQLFADEFKPLP